MVLPADGFVIDVIDVPWWLARRVFFVNKFAHSLASTVEPADTDDNPPDCPYPNIPLALPSIELMLATF